MNLNFKHRITIRKHEKTVNEMYETVYRWVDFKTLWCAIKTVKGTEYTQAVATETENTYRFIIRYTQGITPSMKLIYKGQEFEIRSILNDDENNRTMTIIATTNV